MTDYVRSIASLFLVAAAACGVASACTTTAKKSVAKTALNNMPPEERRETVEATARLLDENLGLVDEVYAITREHRPMLHRFLENATRDLKEPWLADMTADLLVKEPASFQQTMVSSTLAAWKEPRARMALNRALAQQADKLVDIAIDDPNSLRRVIAASLVTVAKKPRARENALEAIRQERQRIIAFVKSDPDLAKETMEQLLREAVKDKPALDKVLRATGAIDDDAPSKAKRQ